MKIEKFQLIGIKWTTLLTQLTFFLFILRHTSCSHACIPPTNTHTHTFSYKITQKTIPILPIPVKEKRIATHCNCFVCYLFCLFDCLYNFLFSFRQNRCESRKFVLFHRRQSYLFEFFFLFSFNRFEFFGGFQWKIPDSLTRFDV